MNAFNKAWSMLKALPEQQGFVMGERQPTMYDQEMTRRMKEARQRNMGRQGTIHPVILGMMQRRQNDRNFPLSRRSRQDGSKMPFPDRRVAIEGEGARYGALEGYGPRSRYMKGKDETLAGISREFHPDQRSGPLSDQSQARRGSIFPYENIDGDIVPPLHGLTEEEIENVFRELGSTRTMWPYYNSQEEYNDRYR